MKLALITQFIRRESRGARGRLFYFTICLAVGVAAVVGVSGMTGAIEGGVAAQNRQLLASDLRISSNFDLPEILDEVLGEVPGMQRARVRELKSMVSVPISSESATTTPRAQLAEIKAIESGYPFYGELLTEPADGRSEFDASSAIVAPELLVALNIELGDEIAVGGARFRTVALVVDEPDRINFSMTLGPRVFLTYEGLDRTNLVQFGSRIRHFALFALPSSSPSEIQALARRLEDDLPDAQNLRIETRESAQARIGNGVERVEKFLGLVALLSLVLGGIGVAQISRTWISERTADIAVRRALGFRPVEILILYLAHILVLAAIGSLIGALVGATLPFFAPLLAPEFIRADQLDPWQPGAILSGLALGLLIALVFAIPPLTAVWRVSPARVLRAEAEPLPAPRSVRIISRIVVLLGVFGCAYFQANDVQFAAAFTGGLLVLAVVLSLAASAVIAASTRLPRKQLSPYLVHGLGALGRPGQGTSGAIMALGMGVLVVTLLVLVEQRLESELDNLLPERAPTAFMIDIQPGQWEGVQGLLDENDATQVESVPVVTARLASIDGVTVRELQERRPVDGERRRANWALSREQRLTWIAELPESNELVEGEWWNESEINEVSVEESYAERLGLELGTKLAFDIQGVPVEVTVTSLRAVKWESFQPNFFFVIEPSVLEGVPHFRIAAARLDEEPEARLQGSLAKDFSNVTVIGIRAIILKVSGVMRQMALGVRILAGFTLLVGIAVLAGAVSSNGLRRAREGALLKTLGLTRKQVIGFFAVEYALVGLVAGAVGVTGAYIASGVFLDRVLQLEPQLSLLIPILAILLSAVTAIVCGLAANLRAVVTRPGATLHGMSGVTS